MSFAKFLRTPFFTEHLRWLLLFSKFHNKAKKVALFPEIGRVKKILSPTRPHKPNVYENIYFLFQKKHTQTKRFPLANLFIQIYVFSLQKIKDRALCFSTGKSAVRVVF